MAGTIVMGYDGSETAKRALRYAVDRVGADGKLVVVCAIDPPPDWFGAPNYQHLLDAARERGDALTSEAREIAGDLVPLEVDTYDGPAAIALAEVARTRNADEIVVGSRGFGRVRAILGSTSHELLHTADRPVVVIPGS